MADDCELTAEDLRNFIAERGGKVTNHELVKHFKKFLNSERQAESRAKFKDLVNAVATIKQEEGVKYLLLKKSANNSSNSDISSVSSSQKSNSLASISSEPSSHHSETNGKSDTNKPNGCSSDKVPTIVCSLSSPCLPTIVTSDFVTPNRKASVPKNGSSGGPWSPDLPPGHTPQPPPRRKNSARGKENRATSKFEENMKSLAEEKENQNSPRREEIKDMVSFGNVKEKTQKLNKMASEFEGPEKNGVTTGSNKRRENRNEKVAYEDDCCSVSTLDPRRKEWVMRASKSDYHELVRLLKEEPKLANCKDLNSYTALHWAAKHGNLDVIKLTAGTHKADANARTSGGYTPLHLAAMFGHEEIMEILINTYGADPMLRDYNGKRPIQYLPKAQAERFVTIFPELVNGRIPSAEKVSGIQFHRIGSLNSKVKKTSVMLTGGKALVRMKSWGSADNIQHDRNLMPPPKFFPKKKKSRRQIDYPGTDGGRGASLTRSGDSDSDSAMAIS